jgi:hypothetical protein
MNGRLKNDCAYFYGLNSIGSQLTVKNIIGMNKYQQRLTIFPAITGKKMEIRI